MNFSNFHFTISGTVAATDLGLDMNILTSSCYTCKEFRATHITGVGRANTHIDRVQKLPFCASLWRLTIQDRRLAVHTKTLSLLCVCMWVCVSACTVHVCACAIITYVCVCMHARETWVRGGEREGKGKRRVGRKNKIKSIQFLSTCDVISDPSSSYTYKRSLKSTLCIRRPLTLPKSPAVLHFRWCL